MHEYRKVSLDYLNEAPHTMQFIIELPVSCEQLFAIFERRDTWQWAGIADVIWDSEPPYDANTKRTIVQPGGAKLDEQFLFWEQNHRMAFRIERGDFSLLGALLEDYLVESAGDGTCRFTWTIAYEFRGWRSALSPLFKMILNRLFSNMTKELETMVVENYS